MKRHIDLLCLFLLAIVTAVFFYPIFQGKQPVPTDTLIGLYHPWRDWKASEYPRGVPFKNFLITDPVRQQIPWRKISIEKWQSGEIPTVNEYNFLGASHIANIQASSFYFFNVLFYIFSFQTAWTILIVFEPLLASVFMYIYLRNLHLHPVAGFFGAVAWAFSGFQIAWLTWGTIVHVSLWLPLMLLSIDKLRNYEGLSRNSIYWLFIFILSHVSAFFAGHTQVFYYTLILSLLYTMAGGGMQFTKPKYFKKFVLGYILLILIVAVQMIPAIKALGNSGRFTEPDNWNKPGWFIPVAHLIQFIIPDFFGNPATLNYWGIWNYGEFIGYIGIIPILFAVFAFFQRRTRDFLLIKFILAGSLLFAVQNPVSEIIYRYRIPILSVLQPTRIMVLVDFSLSVLAAAGLNLYLQKKDATLKRVLIWIAGIFIVVIAVQSMMIFGKAEVVNAENYSVSRRNTIIPLVTYVVFILLYFARHTISFFRTRSQLITILILVITCADLLRFSWKFVSFSPADYFFPETRILSFLRNATKPFRVMSLDDRILPPNVNAFYGIEMLGGYDPVIPVRIEQFFAASERGKPDILPPFGFNRIVQPRNIDSPLLPHTNLRYVLSIGRTERPYLHEVMAEGQTFLYEYVPTLPRVYFACRTIFKSSDEEIMKSLFSSDPQEFTAYIYNPVSSVQKDYECNQNHYDLHSYTQTGMTMTTEGDREGFMVVSMYNQPNIRVFLDNTDVATERVNYLFMGFEVPAGKHEVKVQDWL